MNRGGVIEASKTVRSRAAFAAAKMPAAVGKAGLAIAAPKARPGGVVAPVAKTGAVAPDGKMAAPTGKAAASDGKMVAPAGKTMASDGKMIAAAIEAKVVAPASAAGKAGSEAGSAAGPAGSAVGPVGGKTSVGTAPVGAPVAKAVAAPVAKTPAVAAKTGAGEKTPVAAEEKMAGPVEAKKSAADVIEADKGFQSVKTKIKHDGSKARQHEGGAKKAGDAQSAAKGPANETMGMAKDKQSDAMDQQEPAAFNDKRFKDALREKIKSLKIDTLEDADNFKKNDGASAVKGDMAAQVDTEKQAADGGMTNTVKAEPNAGSEQPKEVGPAPVVSPGVTTTPVDGQAAAPKPVPDADVSLQKDSQELDHQMADAKVTEKQLNKANEPTFTQAVQSKTAAQQDAVTRPVEFRKTEKGLVAQSQTAAVGTGHTHLSSMVAGRNKHMTNVLEHQNKTKAKDEENRKMVSDAINAKFDATKKDVEGLLAQLDKDANKSFDDGIADASRQFEDYVDKKMTAYKDDRYSGVTGGLKWAKDKLFDLPDEVNVFYKEGKDLYVKVMDGVIDRVAKIVADGLNAAKKRINAGKQEIKTYVSGLPKDLQKLGQDAAKDINSKFTELENTVSSKEGELVDSLAQKYKAGMEAVDKKIADMKEANKGWVSKAKAFIQDVINTIIQLKNMLLNVLARAAAAIDLIIEDPIGFLGHLVDGVKLGINNFLANIVSHLKEGLLGWLFGALADAGIEIPKSFDLKGIISLILQVLGLTYRNIRARAVNIVGEKVVSVLEKAAEIFIIIKNEGIGGLWRFIVEKVTALKDTVLDSIKSFVITKIITAGVTWLISLLNPASAFIKACKMIYDVIMFFVERGKQILALVNAVIDSVTAIAKGAISVAANMVEAALAKALPVAISFLASLLGLDGISEKIKGIIEKIQEPINKVIDWVITKAVALVKAAGKFLGFGKDEKKDDTHSPEKQAKIDAGLIAMKAEEQKYLKNGKIGKGDADKVAASVKAQHPVFSMFVAKDEGDKIEFFYAASPMEKGGEVPKADDEAAWIGKKVKYRRDTTTTWSHGQVIKNDSGVKLTGDAPTLKIEWDRTSGELELKGWAYIQSDQIATAEPTNKSTGYFIDDRPGDHEEFMPKRIVTLEKQRFQYVTLGAATFEVEIGDDKLVKSIKGTNLKLKSDSDIASGARGVMQDPEGYIQGENLHRAHLIADQWQGSGYKIGANLVITSKHFNEKVMGGREDEINRFVLDNLAVEFNLSVNVTWGELIDSTVLEMILAKIPTQERDKVKSSIEGFVARLKPGFKRVMDVNYQVTIKSGTSNKDLSHPWSTGPDLWLGKE